MTKKNLMKPPKHVAEFLASLDLVPVTELASLPPEQRFDHAALGEHMELAGVLYKGFALAGLKEEIPHGQYLASLAERDIHPREAQRAVNIAGLSTRVSPSNWTTLSHLPPSKLELMTQWSRDELATFFKGETIRGITLEDAQTSSVRELQRQIKQATAAEDAWKRKEARLEKDKALLQAENKSLKAREVPEGDLPESIQMARESGYLAGLKALDGLWEIEGLYNEIAKGRDISRDPDQAKREYDAGLPGLYVTVMTILAGGSRLAQQLREHFPDYIPDLGDERDIPFLDDEESDRIMKRFNSMLAINRPLREKLTKRQAKQRQGRKR